MEMNCLGDFKVLTVIVNQFLCGVPVKNIDFEPFFKTVTWESQQYLLQQTINNKLNSIYPLKITYQRQFLKSLISSLESRGLEVHDLFYENFCEVLNQREEQLNYKHYVCDTEVVTLKEKNCFISEGTTGLCTWQASLALSEWCLANREIFKNKTILELGSGVGLVGLTIVKFCQCQKICLTDCHHSVLKILSENVKLNLKNSSKQNFCVLNQQNIHTKQQENHQENLNKELINENQRKCIKKFPNNIGFLVENNEILEKYTINPNKDLNQDKSAGKTCEKLCNSDFPVQSNLISEKQILSENITDVKYPENRICDQTLPSVIPQENSIGLGGNIGLKGVKNRENLYYSDIITQTICEHTLPSVISRENSIRLGENIGLTGVKNQENLCCDILNQTICEQPLQSGENIGLSEVENSCYSDILKENNCGKAFPSVTCRENVVGLIENIGLLCEKNQDNLWDILNQDNCEETFKSVICRENSEKSFELSENIGLLGIKKQENLCDVLKQNFSAETFQQVENHKKSVGLSENIGLSGVKNQENLCYRDILKQDNCEKTFPSVIYRENREKSIGLSENIGLSGIKDQENLCNVLKQDFSVETFQQVENREKSVGLSENIGLLGVTNKVNFCYSDNLKQDICGELFQLVKNRESLVSENIGLLGVENRENLFHSDIYKQEKTNQSVQNCEKFVGFGENIGHSSVNLCGILKENFSGEKSVELCEHIGLSGVENSFNSDILRQDYSVKNLELVQTREKSVGLLGVENIGLLSAENREKLPISEFLVQKTDNISELCGKTNEKLESLSENLKEIVFSDLNIENKVKSRENCECANENLLENLKNPAVKNNDLENIQEKLLVENNLIFSTFYQGTEIQVLDLPWEKIGQVYSGSPNVVLAADVVYDSTVFEPLCSAVKYYLDCDKNCEIIFACTERNENTLEEFLKILELQDLGVKEIQSAPSKYFFWNTEVPIRFFKISA